MTTRYASRLVPAALVCMLLGATCVFAADDAADATWQDLSNLLRGENVSWDLVSSPDDFVHNLWVRAERFRRYREQGVTFWNRFPDDARRFEWLVNTVKEPPPYWKDARRGAKALAEVYAKAADRGLVPGDEEAGQEFDEQARSAWDRFYLESLRPKFFSSAQVTSQQRVELLNVEVRRVRDQNEVRIARGAPPDFEPLQSAILQYAAEPAAPEEMARAFVVRLYYLMTLADSGFAAQAQVAAALKASPNAQVRKWGEGRERLLRAQTDPLQLRLSGFDGGVVDLEDLRGKVALVDIWNIDCSGCIEAMPGLRKVYDRYRSQGFEVVGLCTMEKEAAEKPKAKSILKKTGASAWTNGFVAGQEHKVLAERYFLYAAPATWLLDRNGRLVAIDTKESRLDAEIQRLLREGEAPSVPRG